MDDQRALITGTNPHAIPENPGVNLVTMEHEDGENGVIKYDALTFVIMPVGHFRPIRLPDERFDVPQPLVRTCGEPSPGNLGCPSANGCAFFKWLKKLRATGKAPFNFGLRDPRTNGEDAEACFRTYVGRDYSRPNKMTHDYGRLVQGWKVITDKATVRRRRSRWVTDAEGNRRRMVEHFEEPLQHPAPIYAKFTGEDWSMIDAPRDARDVIPLVAHPGYTEEPQEIVVPEPKEEPISPEELARRRELGIL